MPLAVAKRKVIRTYPYLFGLVFVVAAIFVGAFAYMGQESSKASALTTVPTRMNFQGRLADSTGNIKQNGTYNMRLRLYTAASGGTAVWTEDRLVSAGQGVTLTNGLFALQLGSVTSLPASLFASGPLYLEVELPTPATATSSSPSWTEGAMTPRNQMATSAYAYNSETLDGLDSTAFATASSLSGYVQLQGVTPGTAQTGNINITGTIIAGGFSGSGSGLTNLSATNLSSGTIASARITGSYTGITGTGALSAGSIASGFGTIVTGNTIQGTRLISTVATGTAPLTVTSTTKVTNLNVDLLDGLDSTAFAAASGSGSYIQNTTSPQTANFNVTGNGTVGGSLVVSSGANSVTLSNTGIGAEDLKLAASNELNLAASVEIIMNAGGNIYQTAPSIEMITDYASIRGSSGNSVLFTADTQQSKVVIGGSSPTAARLHVEGHASSAAMAWTSRTAASADYWQSITYGNGMFVALSSTVMTSTDGVDWTSHTAAAANTWISVTYGNGRFVAVSPEGTKRAMSSTDGINWTLTSSSGTDLDEWNSVTYGNGMFVAVQSSGGGRVMTSPDGINWTVRSAPQDYASGVTYGNGMFVAVGNEELMTSPDGINWTARTPQQGDWMAVTYGNGLFVAVGNQYNANQLMTSPDGITWTARTVAANFWSSITYGNGLFVAVSRDGTNRVMTSLNGITWTPHAAAQANTWFSVTYGNGRFVAVSNDGTNRVMTSDDTALTTRGSVQVNGDISASGIIVAEASSTSAFSIQAKGSTQALFNADTSSQRVSIGSGTGTNSRVHIEGSFSSLLSTWVARSAPEISSWATITYGNNVYVALSNSGTNRVMTSPDGTTWTSRTAAELNTWNDITFGNGLFVAVAGNGTNRVMTSPDGITWTARSAPAAGLYAVTYGNGLYVATGSGTVNTSPDGINWTTRTAAEANLWGAVTYGNGLFVAVAYGGTNRVMTSPDGITWTARTAAEANTWKSVTYGNGLFVAVSDTGTNRVMTSVNGITWTARTAAEANLWQTVAYGGEVFVALSSDGTNRVMTSSDGSTWTAQAATEANTWEDVVYGNGIFTAISSSGTNRVMSSQHTRKAMSTNGSVEITGDVTTVGNLSVTNTSSSGYVTTIKNSSTSTTADGLLIQLGVANASRTTGNYFVGFADSAGTVAGKIQGGASAVAYTTTGADYAEYFRADPENMPQPGELVTLDADTPNGVELASGAQPVMGVVSTNPGFVGNGPLCTVGDEDCDANYAKTNALVSLVGQVPVKVTGEVKIGDMLGASDTPGVAQKVTSGSYVGYALTTAENGIAQVLIRPGAVNVATAVQGGDATFTNLVLDGSLDVKGDLIARDAEFTGTLTVDGHIIVKGKKPSVSVGDALGVSSAVSVDGTDNAGSISITSSAASTTGIIASITFAQSMEGAHKVVASPTNEASSNIRTYIVKTTNGFDLIAKDPLISGQNYTFDYIVIGAIGRD